MTLICDGYTLEIVKVKVSANWALKAVVDGVVRFRGYRYRRDVIWNISTWLDRSYYYFKHREFPHNFETAEELEIVEVNQVR